MKAFKEDTTVNDGRGSKLNAIQEQHVIYITKELIHILYVNVSKLDY